MGWNPGFSKFLIIQIRNVRVWPKFQDFLKYSPTVSTPFVADHMEYVDGESSFVDASLSVRPAMKSCHDAMLLATATRKWIHGIHVSNSRTSNAISI